MQHFRFFNQNSPRRGAIQPVKKPKNGKRRATFGSETKKPKSGKKPPKFSKTWKSEKYSGRIQRKVKLRMLFYDHSYL